MAPAQHRFTWPGSLEQASCYRHALWAQQIARAMGLELEIGPEPTACPIAAEQTGGAYFCTRLPGHEGPCAARPAGAAQIVSAIEAEREDLLSLTPEQLRELEENEGVLPTRPDRK